MTTAAPSLAEGRASPASRAHLAALIAITTVATIVRIHYLGEAMRIDEAFSYTSYAGRPLSYGLTHYTGNNHLFHTLVVHLATRAFWNSPIVIRSAALVAGIALVPATYAMTRRNFSSSAGLMAAALVAASSALIEYSTNARGYSIVALVFVLLLLIGPDLLRSSSTRVWWLYAALVTIGFYTIPVMLFAFGSIALWLGLSALVEREVDRRRFFTRFAVFTAGSGIITLLLYVPVFATSGASAVFANPFAAPVSWAEWRRGLPSFGADIWRYWNRGFPSVVAGILAAGSVVGSLGHRRVARTRVPVQAAAAAWILAQLAVQRVLPFMRVWLFLIPVYLSVASAGIAWLGGTAFRAGRSAIEALVAVLIAVALSAAVVGFHSVDRSHDSGRLREAEQIATFLAGRLGPSDRVLAISPAQDPLRYYFDLHGIPAASLVFPVREATKVIIVVDKWEGQTLPIVASHISTSVIDGAGVVAVPGFEPVVVLRRFPTAILYEFDRVAA